MGHPKTFTRKPRLRQPRQPLKIAITPDMVSIGDREGKEIITFNKDQWIADPQMPCVIASLFYLAGQGVNLREQLHRIALTAVVPPQNGTTETSETTEAPTSSGTVGETEEVSQ